MTCSDPFATQCKQVAFTTQGACCNTSETDFCGDPPCICDSEKFAFKDITEEKCLTQVEMEAKSAGFDGTTLKTCPFGFRLGASGTFCGRCASGFLCDGSSSAPQICPDAAQCKDGLVEKCGEVSGLIPNASKTSCRPCAVEKFCNGVTEVECSSQEGAIECKNGLVSGCKSGYVVSETKTQCSKNGGCNSLCIGLVVAAVVVVIIVVGVLVGVLCSKKKKLDKEEKETISLAEQRAKNQPVTHIDRKSMRVKTVPLKVQKDAGAPEANEQAREKPNARGVRQ